jgi:hypothetical protein
MTTTRNTGCEDCGRKVTKAIHPTICPMCYDYAGWENTHQDELEHDADEHSTCPICHPELDKRFAEKKAGHTNTVAKTRTSHAGCKHIADSKARAACRKANTWNGTAWV